MTSYCVQGDHTTSESARVSIPSVFVCLCPESSPLRNSFCIAKEVNNSCIYANALVHPVLVLGRSAAQRLSAIRILTEHKALHHGIRMRCHAKFRSNAVYFHSANQRTGSSNRTHDDQTTKGPARNGRTRRPPETDQSLMQKTFRT